MITKTNSILANSAKDVKLNISGEPIIGNSNPIGKCNISQAHLGKHDDNVEAAIMDISSIIALPINSIITNNDGVNPGGSSQILDVTFTGLYNPIVVTDKDSIIENILGVQTEIKAGSSAKEVATAFLNASKKYIDENKLLSASELNADGSGVTITALDFANHEIPDFSLGFQMQVNISTVSPAKSGYGAWVKLGMETKTLPGTAEPIEIHYFKRIA